VPIRPKDRRRRDSQAWSSLYGAKLAAYTAKKISTWLEPTKYFVVSPYGVIDDKTAGECRKLLRTEPNFYVTKGGSSFQNENHLPFTFTQDIWKQCHMWCKENYIYDDAGRKWGEVFSSVDITKYVPLEAEWAHNISTWSGYKQFIGSPENDQCERPKYMVSHRWHGLRKLK
jgi:hypothetical protein